MFSSIIRETRQRNNRERRTLQRTRFQLMNIRRRMRQRNTRTIISPPSPPSTPSPSPIPIHNMTEPILDMNEPILDMNEPILNISLNEQTRPTDFRVHYYYDYETHIIYERHVPIFAEDFEEDFEEEFQTNRYNDEKIMKRVKEQYTQDIYMNVRDKLKNEICPITLTPFESNTKVCYLNNCLHGFEFSELESFILHFKKCPLCNKELTI